MKSKIKTVILGAVAAAVGGIIFVIAKPSGGQGCTFTGTANFYICSSGLDSNSGTTPGAPFLTFQKAYTSAAPGQTVRMACGTYTQTSSGGWSNDPAKAGATLDVKFIADISGSAGSIGPSPCVHYVQTSAMSISASRLEIDDVSFEAPTPLASYSPAEGRARQALTGANITIHRARTPSMDLTGTSNTVSYSDLGPCLADTEGQNGSPGGEICPIRIFGGAFNTITHNWIHGMSMQQPNPPVVPIACINYPTPASGGDCPHTDGIALIGGGDHASITYNKLWNAFVTDIRVQGRNAIWYTSLLIWGNDFNVSTANGSARNQNGIDLDNTGDVVVVGFNSFSPSTSFFAPDCCGNGASAPGTNRIWMFGNIAGATGCWSNPEVPTTGGGSLVPFYSGNVTARFSAFTPAVQTKCSTDETNVSGFTTDGTANFGYLNSTYGIAPWPDPGPATPPMNYQLSPTAAARGAVTHASIPATPLTPAGCPTADMDGIPYRPNGNEATCNAGAHAS